MSSDTFTDWISAENRRTACEEKRMDAYLKDLDFQHWLRIGEEDGRALIDKREVGVDHQLAYDTGYLKGSTSRKEWCQAHRWYAEARIVAGWVGAVKHPDVATAASDLAARIVDLEWRPKP